MSPSVELPYLFDHDPKQNSLFPYDQVDTYEFFLDLGPLSNMNEKYLHGSSQIWNDFLAHSTYDDYWRAIDTRDKIGQIAIPVYLMCGWYDNYPAAAFFQLPHVYTTHLIRDKPMPKPPARTSSSSLPR